MANGSLHRLCRSARVHSGLISALIMLVSIGIAALLLYTSSRPRSQRPPSNAATPRVSGGRADQSTAQRDETDWLPAVTTDRGFVGSAACRDCHTENYASWRDSYHSTMTQVASAESVVPSFDDVTLKTRGRTWELSRRGDEFWVRMPDPDWEISLKYRRGVDLQTVTNPPIVDRRVLMTTGSHNFQTYWVASQPWSLLVQLPWFYSIADGRWIPSEDSFLQPDPGRQFTHWNTFCIKCHAVGGVPGIAPDSPFAKTRVAELGISCEACHGPAEQHVVLHKAARDAGTRVSRDADPIVNPARLTAARASQVCAQCHSKEVPEKDETRFRLAGVRYRAGDDLESLRHILQSGDSIGGNLKDQFWNDGACRVGGDEFNGLRESSCYLNPSDKSQISCLSCHSMHHSDPTDQLAERMDGNHACTQCHQDAQYTDQIEAHTHHSTDSSGSLCYNCHMPHSSFALLKGIRSHRIDSPAVFSTSRPGSRPNACNLCHLDRTLDWTAQHLTDWYDAPAAELNDDDRAIAASLLWTLKGDAAQRVIVAWHMGWKPALEASGDDWQAPFVGQLLQDPYAAVRLVAATALKSLPGFADFEFNAVTESADRSAAVADVVTRWEADVAPQPADERLIDDQGAIQRATLDRLLRERDDTHVFINE